MKPKLTRVRLADFLKEADQAFSSGIIGTPRLNEDGTAVELVSVTGKVLKTIPAQPAACMKFELGNHVEYTIN